MELVTTILESGDLKDNRNINFLGLGVENISSQDRKRSNPKGNIDKLHSINTNNLYLSNYVLFRKIKRQILKWKIFPINMTNKGFIFEM